MDAHTLSPQALEQMDALMAFNWLTAGYAHRDWLGPWSDVLPPRHQVSARLLRRASKLLLERHGLHQRYIRSTSDARGLSWLFVSHEQTCKIAEELGVAMLGGWVRHSLERHAVARQLQVMGPKRRARALTYAARLNALPYPQQHYPQHDPLSEQTWASVLTGAMGCLELGASCMAALLGEDHTGARERFVMRFAQGSVVPLSLDVAQRQEALSLIQELLPQSLGGHARVASMNEVFA